MDELEATYAKQAYPILTAGHMHSTKTITLGCAGDGQYTVEAPGLMDRELATTR